MSTTPKRVEVTRAQNGSLTLRSNIRPGEFNSRYIENCSDADAVTLVQDLVRLLPLAERATLLTLIQASVLGTLVRRYEKPTVESVRHI